MKPDGRTLLPMLAAAGLFVAAVTAQSAGPDVIVGEIDTPDNYGSVGGVSAFAIGTTSCNIGTQILQWQAGNNQHPVISQNMFRLKDGRFEQIGTSWLKHGFFALQLNVCMPCNAHPNGTALGVGCSDPYVASLNGAQGGMGPRSEINAANGAYPFPFLLSPPIAPVTGRRLQALDTELDPAQNANARYFVEAQYVASDDALAGNKNNNASWREVTIFSLGAGGGFGINLAGSTVREQPAIRAWQALDPSVALVTVDVPSDGRFLIGVKVTSLTGGMNRYEYAVQNLNSDRSGGSFSVAFPTGATIANQGFHDAAYHSGEPWSGTDWTPTLAVNGALWATQPFATNQNANALRWGTLYNFRCDSNQAPTAITLGLFKPGTPASITVAHPAAPTPSWQVNQPLATMSTDGLTNSGFVGPIIANKLAGQTGTIVISSTQTGSPWDLALTAGPGIAGSAGAAGQILNLDLADPTLTFMNGGFLWSNWNPASVTIPYTCPATAFNRSGQFAIVTPQTAGGFALSALNEIRVTVCQGGTQPLTLGDDDSVQVQLGGPNHCGVPSVNFYGTTYTSLFVNSNGSVSFVQGTTTFTATATAFVTLMPRLAGLWTDLDPSSGGTISAASTPAGLFTVTWSGVPEYGSAVTSSFAVQFNAVTGACAILNYAPGAGHATDSLVGISPGAGAVSLPQGFSGLTGAGPQTGNPNGAIYQISFGGAPPGFTRIDFPNGNGAGFFVN